MFFNKKIFFIFIIFLSTISFGFSANVNVSVQIYSSQAFFTYNIYFNKSENYNTFAIEKPLDAKLIFADQDKNRLDFTTLGNKFIFAPVNGTINKKFQIQFSSNQIAQQIYQTDSFSTYQNFNFPIKNLKFNVIFKKNMPKPYQIFPRNYEIINGKQYFWNLKYVGQNTFFLINFNTSDITKPNNNLVYFWLSLVIFIIIFGIFFYLRKNFLKSIEKLLIKNNKNKKMGEKTFNKIDEKKEEEEEKIKIESFEEIIKKYLTEKEKEIVLVIKENEGILQNDILNFVTNISKSNLSKIIKKLHNKKFINRIKVGKANKIFLAEKLKLEEHKKIN